MPGADVYLDTLVIKFEDHCVEASDPLKGHALMLFRRVFSSSMRPEDGFAIDPQGQAPEIYAPGKASNLENAPYLRRQPDRVYEVLLRSTGEVVITPGAVLSGRARHGRRPAGEAVGEQNHPCRGWFSCGSFLFWRALG